MSDVRVTCTTFSTARNCRTLLVLLLAVMVASCSRGAASDSPAPNAGSPNAAGRRGEGARGEAARGGGGGGAIVVTTATVVQKPMAVDVRAVGNVEASSSVEVRPQVAGELLSVGFKEGQDVTAGQLMFTIDPRQYEVALRQAEAANARSVAQAKGM